MRKICLALAVFAAAPAIAQTAQTPQPAYGVRAGSWAYVPTAGGSEAAFMDASGTVAVSLRCLRATRQIALSLRGSNAKSIAVWTSSATRTLPAIADPATGRTTATLFATDSLLDAIAFSRGRISFSAVGVSPLVVPAWAEPARAVEDCRN